MIPIESIFFGLLSMIIGIFIVDIGMNYLQSEDDPWRIPLTAGRVNFQFVALILCASSGYAFGHHVGISLPNDTLNETIVIGCTFSCIASTICRGYVMLHFHKVRSDKLTYRTSFTPEYRPK